jgi:quinohemoprotein ethanol dehydrogenase
MFHPANARSGSALTLGLIFAASLGQAGPAPNAGRSADTDRSTSADRSTNEGNHYSSLADINRTNVSQLGLAWEFGAFAVRGGIHRGAQSTPLVVDGVMYFTGPWSVVYAVDAKDGRLLWQYDPEVKGEFARHACCDAVNRGVAVENGVAYLATLDGYLVALNAKTGKPVWKVDTFVDRSRSLTITGVPQVAGSNVVIGNAGAEMGARGYASAFDKRSGKLAWRFYTVPGDPSKGDESPEIEAARKTWSAKSRWDLGGGGNPWGWFAYDAATHLVFLGTGNGMPQPVWTRSPGGGDNLYVASILAINADTGRLKWHYQTTPGDSWDYDATQNFILEDLTLGGRLRQVLMQASKNGFFYVLDRGSGELLAADKYAKVTWADRVDMKNGRPLVTTQADFSQAPKVIWPSQAGGHNWQPMAFSETTKLVYIPTLEAPMKFLMMPQEYQPFSVIQGDEADWPWDSPPDRESNTRAKPAFETVLKAWDPIKGAAVWTSQPMPYWGGGVLATGGDLVVQGSPDGYLTFYDSLKGTVLHRIPIGTGIMAAPMTYSLNGRQYISVLAGMGGAMGTEFPPGAIGKERENKERLLVFTLGGGPVALPPERKQAKQEPAATQFRGSASSVARGEKIFNVNCGVCHGGPGAIGIYPDLFNMPADVHAAFDKIVLDGVFNYAGMASFSDVLSKQDVADVHAYLSRPKDKVPN